MGADARPYWFSDERWAARGLLAAVVALNLGIVYINVLINKWQNDFYNALQDKDMRRVLSQLLWNFSALAGAYIVCAVYQLYLNQMLQIRWRRWLTDRYLERWIGGRRLLPDAAHRPRDRQPGSTGRRRPRAVCLDRTLLLTLGLPPRSSRWLPSSQSCGRSPARSSSRSPARR